MTQAADTTSPHDELRRLWTLLGKQGHLTDAITQHGPDQLLARLQAEHARHQSQADAPVLLHRDSTHGYTHEPRLALPDEPEAIDPHAAAALAAQAEARYQITHATELMRRTHRDQLTRIRDLQAKARKAGVDITHELKAAIDQCDAKLRDAA